MADDLHRGTYMADLLVHALESNLDKPCVYLGDQVLTAREVRDEMSRYSQALAGLGLTKGSPMSVLADWDAPAHTGLTSSEQPVLF